MGALAASTGLQLGVDVVGFASADALAGYIYDNAGAVQVDAGVVFPGNFSAATVPGSVSAITFESRARRKRRMLNTYETVGALRVTPLLR